MAKPTKLPEWATSGTKVEPSAAKKDSGWLNEEKPPFEYFNYWQNLVSLWVEFFDGAVGDFESGSFQGQLNSPSGGDIYQTFYYTKNSDVVTIRWDKFTIAGGARLTGNLFFTNRSDAVDEMPDSIRPLLAASDRMIVGSYRGEESGVIKASMVEIHKAGVGTPNYQMEFFYGAEPDYSDLVDNIIEAGSITYKKSNT